MARVPVDAQLRWPHRIRAVVFDMDGVLIDSEPVHFEATRLVLARHGVPYTEEDHRSFLGMTFPDACLGLETRYGLTADWVQAGRERTAAITRRLRAGGASIPGVAEALVRLHARQYPLAVASSSSPELIRVKLDVLGFGSLFAATVSGADVPRAKPAPDIFVAAAARLGVAPEACVAVEDSRNGLLAAKAAGMCCAVVPCGATRHQDFAEADLVLSRAADLLPYLPPLDAAPQGRRHARG